MKGEDKTERRSEETIEEKPPYEKPSHCLICGQMGPALLYGHWICDHCRNVVQAEAVAQKRKIVKDGGGPPAGR
jgi:transposase